MIQVMFDGHLDSFRIAAFEKTARSIRMLIRSVKKMKVWAIVILLSALVVSSCSHDEVRRVEVKVSDNRTYTAQGLAEAILGKPAEGGATSEYQLMMEQVRGAFLDNVRANIGSEDAAFHSAVISYESIGASGEPLWLTERVVWPDGAALSFVLLDCHFTITSTAEAPSRKEQFSMLLSAFGAAVVMPDYEGYGGSDDRIHPYLAHNLMARQCVDGLRAAYAFLRDEAVELKQGYRTWITGYSQGGSQALACQKYIDTQCSTEDRELFRLKGSYCGGGAYSPSLTMDWYFENGACDNAVFLPMVVQGMKVAHPDIMRDVAAEDCFAERVLNTELADGMNLLEYVATMRASSSELATLISQSLQPQRLTDLMSDDFKDHGSEVYKAFRAALEAEDLTSGWTPHESVKLYHVKEDSVVPYINAESAARGLGIGSKSLETSTAAHDHLTGGMLYYYNLIVKGEFAMAK